MNAPARVVARALPIELVDEAPPHARVICARIVVIGGDLPEIVMFNGDPYLRDRAIHAYAWRKEKPYRLDVGE